MTSTQQTDHPDPYFHATLSSPRPLLHVLRAISFATRAHIQILSNGVRLSVEDSRVMQAHAWLDNELFQKYEFIGEKPEPDSDNEAGEDADVPGEITFSISLSALMESLSILSSALEPQTHSRWGSVAPSGGVSSTIGKGGPAAVFDHQVLRMAEGETMDGAAGKCKLAYGRSVGEGLVLVMEDPTVTTTVSLTTYISEALADIPIDPSSLIFRIVMKATWIHDAMVELDGSAPTRLVLTVSPEKPYFALAATGGNTSAMVEFPRDASLLETFVVKETTVIEYKFGLVKHAVKSMGMASKVSIRGDEQGVLSMQFMLENEGSQKASFVDFRFLPLEVDDED